MANRTSVSDQQFRWAQEYERRMRRFNLMVVSVAFVALTWLSVVLWHILKQGGPVTVRFGPAMIFSGSMWLPSSPPTRVMTRKSANKPIKPTQSSIKWIGRLYRLNATRGQRGAKAVVQGRPRRAQTATSTEANQDAMFAWGLAIGRAVPRPQIEAPTVFQRIVIELLVKMGYGGSRADAAQAIGIDGFIKEDRLGLDIIYVQAKRWAATVGRPEIQKFAGRIIRATRD